MTKSSVQFWSTTVSQTGLMWALEFNGCLLSIFFNIFLELVMNELVGLQQNLNIDNSLTSDKRYVSDITLISAIFKNL